MARQFSQFLCIIAAAMIGCAQPESFETEESRSLPVISGSQLDRFVTQSEAPVLVEFGVDFQCDRCRQMKIPIVDLADRFKGQAEVIRVDFNANAEMVSQLGGTICPTYVLFQDGKPIHLESYPVSADILESRLSEIVQ